MPLFNLKNLCYNGCVMKVNVFAKLNLSLNVFAKQGQFHPIDSVVTSVDLCDEVTVHTNPSGEVFVNCDGNIPPTQNVAYKAACAFRDLFGTGGCSVKICKGIPVGAGMGGSSADAAAVVECLCKLYGVDGDSPQVHSLCASLGSDVNFVRKGGLARMTGKGDNLQFAQPVPLYFAVTFFSAQLSAQQVYDKFDLPHSQVPHADNDKLLHLLASGKVSQALALCSNGLQPAACNSDGFAEKYLHFCRQNNLPCTMTGSGSAFFVPFASLQEAQNAVNWLNLNGFVTKLVQSVPNGVQVVNLF